MSGSSSVPLVAGALLFFCAIYKFIIYPSFLSPLAKIPNAHFTSGISPLWILWKRYQRRENRDVWAANQRNGPVVRLGPNEVSVTGVEGGIRTVYGGGFEKGTWYQTFDNYGIPCMFSTSGSKQHSALKKMMSNVYSKTYISSSEAVHKQTEAIIKHRLLPLLAKAAVDNTPIEVIEVYFSTTMDLITAFLFGLQSSSDFLSDIESWRQWFDTFHKAGKHLFWEQELPRLTHYAHALGLPLRPRVKNAAWTTISAWCLSMCDAAHEALSSSSTSPMPGDTPVVYNQLLTQGSKEREKSTSNLSPTYLSDQRLGRASELLDHLVAGFETSGITLMYLTYELSRNQELQAELRAELLTLNNPSFALASTATTALPDYKDVDALPILNAVVTETLRLYAAIPGIQPRVTPAVPGGVTLGTGRHTYTGIPAGVRVNASAHTLHRNEGAFPNASVWQHERWLESKKTEFAVSNGSGKDAGNVNVDDAGAEILTKEKAYWPFSSGGRMCVGSNFAIHSLKMTTAAIYTNFVTTVVDDEGIEQGDGYTVGPRGGRLVLGFERA